MVLLAVFLFGFVPEDFDDADLLQEGVRDPCEEDFRPVVLAGQNPVDVIGRLLRCGYVFRAFREELNDLIAAREDTHQGRLDPLNRVHDGGIDYLGAAFDLIAVWLRGIAQQRLFALF